MQKVTIDLNESGNSPEKQNGFLEKITYYILLAIPLLLPIFFLSPTMFPFQISKSYFLSIFVLIAFVAWLVARLKDGKFVFPATKLMLASAGIALVTTISAFLSGAVRSSFVGQAIDLGTASSLFVFLALMFLVPTVFRSKDRIFYSYLMFFVSFFILAVFHGLRLFFGASFMAGGIFTDITSSMLGKWNDLAVFFGIGAILSIITLELISLSKLFKVLSYLALIVSIFFLAVVNLTPVWYVMAIFSLIFMIYVLSFDKSESGSGIEMESQAKTSLLKKLPITSLVVLAISITFILGGQKLGQSISDKFGINQLEARPSWATTFAVTKSIYSHDPIFGSGPNRFNEKWVAYKPDGINPTIFWNTDFSFGIGFVPTMFATTGLLGAVAWLLFLGLYIYVGFKSLLTPVPDKFSRYLIDSSFLVSLFLWVLNIFYIPGLPVVALTFFFTGIFIASANEAGLVFTKTFSFVESPKKGFISVLVLILLLAGSVATAYSFTEKFIASIYSQKGVVAFNLTGNVDSAQGYFLKAVALDELPIYYRSLAQIDLLKMSNLLAQDPKSVSADVVRTQFQSVLSSALSNAQKAVDLDKNDYQNWVILGQVYESVVPLKIPNAYESARDSYKQALVLNPQSPALYLTQARLELTKGDNTKAKENIAKALQLKNNYTDAIFLLAQIQVAEGNLKDAIESVQAASYLSPNDSGVFFQLGLLRYNNKDYNGAISALEHAVQLNPVYANAKYFLGLSYQKVGRVTEAITQFKDIKVTNPDNKEVDLILKNLNAGLSPFSNATPPIDSTPEKRSKPPVVEKSASKSKTSSQSVPEPDSPDSADSSL